MKNLLPHVSLPARIAVVVFLFLFSSARDARALDTTPPTFILIPNDIVVAAETLLGSVVPYAPALAIDNSLLPVTIEYSHPSGSLFAIGSHTVVVTARDLSGNETLAEFTVNVVDPLALSANAGPDVITRAPTLLDGQSNGAISHAWSQVSGPPGGSVAFGSANAEDTTASATVDGAYVLRLTVTSLLLASRTDEITFVWDTTPPSLSSPGTITVEATSAAGANVQYPSLSATDETAVTIGFSIPDGALFPVGVTAVAATATDAAGNATTVNFNVAVVDTQPPVVTSSLVAAPAEPHVLEMVTFMATVSDASAVSWSWSFGDGTSTTSSSGSVTHVYTSAGTFPVAATATDAENHSTTSTLTLTVLPAPGSGGDGSDGGGTGGDGAGGNGTGGDGTIGGGDGTTTVIVLISITKLNGKVSFKDAGRDSYAVQGVIPNVPTDFAPAGKPLTLSVGGAAVPLVLDGKGKAAATSGNVKLKMKYRLNKATRTKEFLGGSVPFTAKAKKGTFLPAWRDEGVDPLVAKQKAIVPFIVSLVFNGVNYTATVNTVYSSRIGRSAAFKF